MVILSAAVLNKRGNVLLSRQYVDASRSRIEGLLAAFPKLLQGRAGVGGMSGSSREHTHVETDSVRYVFHPLEGGQRTLLLVTTKTSNILEDLTTLRMLASVLSEQSPLDDHIFDALFALDEVVSPQGHREATTTEQVRRFLSMESQEEKLAQMIRESKEYRAKEEMRARAKEIEEQKALRRQTGGPTYGGISSEDQGASGMYVQGSVRDGRRQQYEPSESSVSSSSSTFVTRAKKKEGGMQLRMKRTEGELFEKARKEEGVRGSSAPVDSDVSVSSVDGLNVKCEEQLVVVVDREGAIESAEVKGEMSVTARSGSGQNTALVVSLGKSGSVQWKTHPRVDRIRFQKDSVIVLKGGFPDGSTKVLRWRMNVTEVPLSVSCWPSDNGEVTIEYEMTGGEELNDVALRLRIPEGSDVKKVDVERGESSADKEGRGWIWSIGRLAMDSEEVRGTAELNIVGMSDTSELFPLDVTFRSNTLNADVKVASAQRTDGDGNAVDFSVDNVVLVERYTVG